MIVSKIVGASKLHDKIKMLQELERADGCQGRVSDLLCSNWKVPVSEEECAACNSGDPQARVVVIDRAISSGAQRRRPIRSCEFVGEITGSAEQSCCGGKTQTVYRFRCQYLGVEVYDGDCYTCTNFKEKTDVKAG